MESATVWLVTIGVLSLVVAFDLLMAILRRDKETTITESSIWTVIYVSAAIVFGILMPNWVESPTARPEFSQTTRCAPARLSTVVSRSRGPSGLSASCAEARPA